ncbi:hypothetical protein Pelo_14159 [Pelomyxa schiedti]|nr:hypothetical protein Pelo_14159 [Pelomyxa schiedti]
MAGATASMSESATKCLQCVLGSPAVAVCVQCEFSLCSSCLRAHILSVKTTEHTFRPIRTTAATSEEQHFPSIRERTASSNFLKDQTNGALVPFKQRELLKAAIFLFGAASWREGGDIPCASISLNTKGAPVEWYNNFSLGANSLATHPWSDNDTVIQWKYGYEGSVEITAAVSATMLDSGKNTVALYHNKTTTVGGPWAMNGRGSHVKELVTVTMSHGDTLWLRSSIVGLCCNQMQIDMQILF